MPVTGSNISIDLSLGQISPLVFAGNIPGEKCTIRTLNYTNLPAKKREGFDGYISKIIYFGYGNKIAHHHHINKEGKQILLL